MKKLEYKQQGASAIVAIVLVVFLGLIGGYMATQSSVSSFSTTQSLGSMQSWYAARSGLDWAIFDAVNNGAASLNCNGGPDPTFSVSAGSGASFDIQVTCTSSTFVEGGNCPILTPCTSYTFTVVADRGSPGDLTYISRTLNASITDVP